MYERDNKSTREQTQYFIFDHDSYLANMRAMIGLNRNWKLENVYIEVNKHDKQHHSKVKRH